jgi:hypothetical protein
MKMKMHALAVGRVCGVRGVKGFVAAGMFAASNPSALNSEARARVPRPLAAGAKKSRRVRWIIPWSSMGKNNACLRGRLLTGYQFVQV